MVILFLGLNTSNFLNKSIASSDAFGKKLVNPLLLVMLIDCKMFYAKSLSKLSTSSWLGLPVSSNTLSIWFNVDVPGNMALPTIISPRMQPTLHISTALVYFLLPNNISGALYHLVATYSVRTGAYPSSSLIATDLANPKSATF